MGLVAGKMFDLVTLVAIWAIALFLIYSKREIWIRRLPALDFIEEAVGRAAEMGRPVVCQGFGSGSSGLQSSIAPMIMAGLAVLGHAARICARHGTQIVATMRSESVVPVADEVLRTAYRLEGKLDEYEANREEMLPWLPTQAAMVALGQRIRPAAHIIIGAFWHESVQIAESYGRIGAVQIGGTGRLYQIPFFAAVCDMNLIGEEIYAVGAYINQTPEMLASIATQDYFKVAGIILVILGTLMATMGMADPLLSLFAW
ncbi:MAG: hypothetical protein PVJ38_07590 [Candidatus Bathyarchaeota archaeon]|jgi:hypothetical protein